MNSMIWSGGSPIRMTTQGRIMPGTLGLSTGMNHVGLTVGDIDKAIRWYQDVFGLILLVGPLHCDTTTAGAARRNEVFGSQWAGMKLAHMLTDNGCGLELFEFVTPQGGPPEDNFQYWKYGASHIAFTVDDFDRTLDLITST